ncbi:hypothetical protein TNIN_263651 [Trichonephila inaurata madagascariensis]|uniref:Uncharacterized protein n=1 Tax=Trichonephila inaurata madagascariensis TaxID=2747483 RepID=A0A8X6XZZ3_9ARAC|nr:hypothetical protein TNIN_263651 [Trichonephila inaurata madagascariensis]
MVKGNLAGSPSAGESVGPPEARRCRFRKLASLIIEPLILSLPPPSSREEPSCSHPHTTSMLASHLALCPAGDLCNG